MSRVLLGHSYFLRFDPKLWQAMQPYPPLGTLYAAAVLREHGHEVRFFDAMLAESTDGWRRMLTDERPDVAVLFEDNFNYLSKMCLLRMREAAFEMIGAAREYGCRVIVGGADVTDNAADYLRRGASFALLGEGEETLCELLAALESGGDPNAVLGLAYLDESGEVVSTGRRPVIRDLDVLPPPARDLVDMDAYRRAWRPHGRHSMNLVTSRGCPFHCNWCAKPIWGQRYGVRSPRDVAEEIRGLRALGAQHLWFMDDILGLKPGWLPEFAAIIESEGLSTPFKCLSRADLLLRPGEVDALAGAGCEMVWLGAESGSQSVLDAMEKGTTVEQVREATRQLRAAGIGVAFFLQFGYPGETWDDIQRTLQLVRDCDPDDVGVSVSYPLPGTPFHERVRDRILGRHNWIDSSDLAMLYDGPYPTSFYHLLHSRLHAEFRLQKAQRGRPLLPALVGLLRHGQLKRTAGVCRDAALVPLLQARLELARRRAQHDASSLPTELSRDEAATPSAQDEAVAARR
jgi:anaerobic magnesium-protoporphyrin IX monomethyl ester cyclase